MSGKPYRNHLRSSNDLQTPYEEIRAGFLSLALEKSRQAIPFVKEAKALKAAASKARTPAGLLVITGIESALFTAAGLSNKAMGHLKDVDKEAMLKEWITKVLEPAGVAFVDELVYRFLLTKGDTLGGIMRNLAGALGERKFTRAVLAALTLRGISYYWHSSKSDDWIKSSKNDVDIESQLNGLSWVNKGQKRTILYNRKVKIVGKNIDISLLNCSQAEVHLVCDKPDYYIAFGELKGGIDPAGADEHWKTANSALGRIRESFLKIKLSPGLFFVGAAIEASMATEIWEQLEKGNLDNAANLTNADQLASLCDWLINI